MLHLGLLFQPRQLTRRIFKTNMARKYTTRLKQSVSSAKSKITRRKRSLSPLESLYQKLGVQSLEANLAGECIQLFDQAGNGMGAVDYNQLDGCCGVGVMYNLSGALYHVSKMTKITPAERAEAYKLYRDAANHSCVMVTDTGRKNIQALKLAGFRENKKFVNQNSGNTVSVLTYTK